MHGSWKEASLLHKTVTILSILVSLSVVVLAFLQIFDVWENAVDLCVLLMGVTMLFQAYMQWPRSRKVAYISIGTAALVCICSIIVLFLK